MAIQLERLKKELFAYLEKHPKKGRNKLRDAGFGTHLNKLYNGSWIEAHSDFEFYQFIRTAQSYLSIKPIRAKQKLEKALLNFSFYFEGSPEQRLLIAILGEKVKREKQQTLLLNTIKTYITKNSPVYTENYKLDLLNILQKEGVGYPSLNELIVAEFNDLTGGKESLDSYKKAYQLFQVYPMLVKNLRDCDIVGTFSGFTIKGMEKEADQFYKAVKKYRSELVGTIETTQKASRALNE